MLSVSDLIRVTTNSQKAIEAVRDRSGDAGPQGETGPQGDAGPQGTTGLKGDQGDAGSQGTTGLKGDQGDAGPQGTTGLKGDQGDAGAQGVAGDETLVQTYTYAPSVLVTNKAVRLEITLDADWSVSSTIEIIFRHSYPLGTSLHATSQTTDAQVQWVSPRVDNGDGSIETYMNLLNAGTQVIATGQVVNIFITLRE
jgi:hypothetical protein